MRIQSILSFAGLGRGNVMHDFSSNRIIIVCQDNIGDLVFTSSAIVAIKKHFKGSVLIDVVTRNDTAEVAGFLPLVNKILPAKLLSRLGFFPWTDQAKEFKRIKERIVDGRYDVAVMVGKNWRLGYLCRKAGIPVRIGFDFPKLKIWLTHSVPRPSVQVPVLTGLDSLLKILGIDQDKPEPYQLDLRKVSDSKERLKENIIGNGNEWQWFSNRKRVGLHAFASKNDRCVPLNVWVETAKKLEASGWSVLWIGTKNELNRLKEIKAVPGFYSDEIGNGSISDSIALLSYCNAYVGHDSGVLHLASAIGIRSLGIFAPGQPERTFAQGIVSGMTLFKPGPELISSEMMIEYFRKCFSEDESHLL